MSKVGDDIKLLFNCFVDEYAKYKKYAVEDRNPDVIYDCISRMNKKDSEEVNQIYLPELIIWIDEEYLEKILDCPNIHLDYIYDYNKIITTIRGTHMRRSTFMNYLCEQPNKFQLLINHGFDIHKQTWASFDRKLYKYNLIEYIEKNLCENLIENSHNIMPIIEILVLSFYDIKTLFLDESIARLNKLYLHYKNNVDILSTICD